MTNQTTNQPTDRCTLNKHKRYDDAVPCFCRAPGGHSVMKGGGGRADGNTDEQTDMNKFLCVLSRPKFIN